MQIFRRVCLCERASQKTIRHEASQGHIHFVDVFTLMDTLQPHGLQLSRSSVHGIFVARILEWVAISSSRESSQPRD